MIEAATLGIDVITKSEEESQTLDVENTTLEDTTPSMTSNSDSAPHNKHEKARTLLEEEREEESSGQIMIGSATSAVALLALVVVLVLVVTRKSKTNLRHEQVQQAIIYKVKDIKSCWKEVCNLL